jgi:hypothetical protein
MAQHRPGDAGELVSERNGEFVGMHPARGRFDPRL